VVAYLAESPNIDLNVKDSKNYDGWTVLHFCSAFGKLELLQVLLQKGGDHLDKTILTGSFQSAYDLATTPEIRQLLIGATTDALHPQLQQILDTVQLQPSVPSLEQQPQQQQQLSIPATTSGVQHRSSLNKMVLFKAFAFLLLMLLFVLPPIIWLSVNPYDFPWWIFPSGSLLLLVALVKLHQNKSSIIEKAGGLPGSYGFKVHKTIFIIVNSMLVIGNIVSRGFPWSFVVLVAWGCLLGIHKIRTKHANSETVNNYFVYHLIMYTGLKLILFVSYMFSTCETVTTSGSGSPVTVVECNRFTWELFIWLIPVGVGGLLLVLHFVLRMVYLRRLAKQQQPVILEEQQASEQYSQQVDLEDGGGMAEQQPKL
jgi:hypothetical protein